MTVEESITQLTIVIGGLSRIINETATKVDTLIDLERQRSQTEALVIHQVRRVEEDVERLRERVLDLETHPRLAGNGAAE